jgi:hypothetical protein
MAAGKEKNSFVLVSIRKKTIRSHLENFLETLQKLRFQISFNGIKLILKWLLINFVLILYYFVGCYFTFTSLVDTFRQYGENPTVFQVDSNYSAQEELNAANITFCFPKSSFKLSEESESETETKKTSFSNEINIFFNKSIIDGKFQNYSSRIWPNEVYLLIWEYLSIIYESENGRYSCEKLKIEKNVNDDARMALKNILVPKIIEFNITIDQLKAVFDGKLRIIDGWWVQNKIQAEYLILAISLEDEILGEGGSQVADSPQEIRL